MKASNNLNQLLSRVKSIFGRKATSTANTPLEGEPPTGHSVVSDPRLSSAFADIEKYLSENYGILPAKLQYKEYTNGASLPVNVLLLGGVTSTNDVEWLAAELRKFTNLLMQLCPKHRIQHLAFAFDKTESDDPRFVKEADVTCIRLY